MTGYLTSNSSNTAHKRDLSHLGDLAEWLGYIRFDAKEVGFTSGLHICDDMRFHRIKRSIVLRAQ